jgi:hypothetical protein
MCFLLTALTACSTGEEKQGMPDAERSSRPSMQEVSAAYEQATTEAQEAVDDLVGQRAWARDSETSRSLCPGDEEPRLQEWGLPRRTAPGGIPDAEWQQAVDSVSEVLARHDFGPPETVVDRPGDHEVQYRDEHGAVLLFGAYVNTVLSVRTGCHPVEDEAAGS